MKICMKKYNILRRIPLLHVSVPYILNIRKEKCIMVLKVEKFPRKYTHDLQYTVGIESRYTVGTCEHTPGEHIARCMMGAGHVTMILRHVSPRHLGRPLSRSRSEGVTCRRHEHTYSPLTQKWHVLPLFWCTCRLI